MAHLSTRGKQVVLPNSGHIQFDAPDAVLPPTPIHASHRVRMGRTGQHDSCDFRREPARVRAQG
jgi:hypothetical protein